jgi:hypothetical protein
MGICDGVLLQHGVPQVGAVLPDEGLAAPRLPGAGVDGWLGGAADDVTAGKVVVVE